MDTRKDTKTVLIQTALDLMWSQSYGGVSVDDICREAGAKKGSFYHYFASKAELTKAGLEYLWDTIRPQLDDAFSPQRAPLERLKLYAEASYKEQAELAKRLGYIVGCPFTSIGSEQCSCDDGLSVKATEILMRVTTYLRSAVKDAVDEGSIPAIDAQEAAEQLLTYELGALSLARVSNKLDPIHDLYDVWFAMLGGVKDKPAQKKRAGK